MHWNLLGNWGQSSGALMMTGAAGSPHDRRVTTRWPLGSAEIQVKRTANRIYSRFVTPANTGVQLLFWEHRNSQLLKIERFTEPRDEGLNAPRSLALAL